MSTMIALFLVFAALVGCVGETGVNVENAPPPAALTFRVETEVYEETVRDGDGAELAVCAYELPELTVLLEDGTPLETAATEEQARALAAAGTFNARFAQWKSNPTTLAESAKEDRAFRNESGLEAVAYSDDLSCAVYQTESLISVSGVYSTYTGGAHPNRYVVSYLFDLEAGQFIDPLQLADDPETLRTGAAARLLEKAEEHPAFDSFWQDYPDLIARWNEGTVLFDGAGMKVIYSPYEIAPYGMGDVELSLDWEELEPLLGPEGMERLGRTEMK